MIVMFLVPPVSPNLAVEILGYYKAKAQDIVLNIFTEASPNAQHEIYSPLPRLTAISIPLAREWIYDKNERLQTASPSCFEIGDFL